MKPLLLLIDDESNFLRQLEKLFDRHEFSCATALTDQEALGLLAKGTFDLIVVDVGMDRGRLTLDRQNFLADIRQRARGAPIVGISGSHLGVKDGYALAKLCDDFLEKLDLDHGADEFVRRIKHLIETQRSVDSIPEPERPKRYRVALSFPGERRETVVKPVALALAERLGKESIFYDEFWQADLARFNLDTHLEVIYGDLSDLIVVFLCKEYDRKQWCGLEFRVVRSLVTQHLDDKVMLLWLDADASPIGIPGILAIDSPLDVTTLSPPGPASIAHCILERLERVRADAP